MTDYFYRFLDQATMFLLLIPLGMVSFDDDGNPSLIQGNHQYAAWQMGEISGYEGWHLNLRIIDPEFDVLQLRGYQVFPSSPSCVWA